MANAANITRRSIFKLAPAAVLATGGAIVAFPAKSEPLTLDQEIDQAMDRLKALISSKYPDSKPVHGFYDGSVKETREGGYLVCLMGNPPKIAWSGEGYYEIFAKPMDNTPTLMWVEQSLDSSKRPDGYLAYAHVNGKRKSGSHYFSDRTLCIYKKI